MSQEEAVTTLMKAKSGFWWQRRWLQMRARKNFRLRPRFSATYYGRPWSQVIAWARLAHSGDDHPSADGRLSADVRYIGLIGNLVRSSRPELAVPAVAVGWSAAFQ